jgi:hypothetical protein
VAVVSTCCVHVLIFMLTARRASHARVLSKSKWLGLPRGCEVQSWSVSELGGMDALLLPSGAASSSTALSSSRSCCCIVSGGLQARQHLCACGALQLARSPGSVGF